MTKHAFLSQEWIEAARAIHAEHAGAEPPAVSVRMNLVVEGVPFGGGQLDAHVDTSSGVVDVELGHLDAPDVKVNLDYDTAKSVLVDGDAQVAMQAFMAGKVRVEGDMTKLLAFQSAPPSPRQALIAEQVRAITG
ncbi:MAG TPA: SCP2 sterol-binding domain-containing protein [Acidimicrobiales bacterium]|nr:SCP2 sterol-binding domain-containing protein [Acidimicrobiales bacterium]